MGVGPVFRTSLSTGLSEWELGPRHAEQFPILNHKKFSFQVEGSIILNQFTLLILFILILQTTWFAGVSSGLHGEQGFCTARFRGGLTNAGSPSPTCTVELHRQLVEDTSARTSPPSIASESRRVRSRLSRVRKIPRVF